MAILDRNPSSKQQNTRHNGRQLAVTAGLTLAALGLVMWNWAVAGAMLDALALTDFGKFFYSAQEFLSGRDMYGPTAATLIQIDGWPAQHHWNLNPPHFHFLALPFAVLPLYLALLAWLVVGLLALFFVIIVVVRELRISITPKRILLATIGVLAFAATQLTISTGQLTFLLLVPVTFAWIGIRRGQWVKAGLWLGLAVSVKPFLLIFLPYLLLKRQYKAVAAAAGAVVLCFLLGIAVFGIDAHLNWLRVLGTPDWVWDGRNASILGVLERTFDASPYYSPLAMAPTVVRPVWLITAALVGIVTLALSRVGSDAVAVDRSFALLLAGAQLVSPLGWLYYSMLLIGPVSAMALTLWRERKTVSTGMDLKTSRASVCLLALAALCFVWPYMATAVFQPAALATVTVGSVFFWGTFLLWLALAFEGLRSVSRRRQNSRTRMVS